MSDLEPITQEETAWVDGDLEPVTRKEQYLNRLTGEEQAIPETPVTRTEQYLAKLCVEETEIPSSPITREETYLAYLNGENVTLPEPITRLEQFMAFAAGESETKPTPLTREEFYWDKYQGGEVLKDFPGLPASIVTVTDAVAKPLGSLKVDITLVQEGSGDPSPENVRPISGWTGCNVTVSPTQDAEDGTTYPITFPSEAGTVYGGTLDVTNGTLTVDKTKIRLNDYLDDVGIVGSASRRYFRIDGIVFPEFYRLCEKIKNAQVYSTTYDIGIGMGTPSGTSGYRLSIRPPQVSGMTVEEFRDYINGMGDVYVVVSKTPITYQLTPTEVQMLLGTNNIWADTGDILEGKYWAKRS